MNKCVVAKQGPCGFFCIKYWLDGGCDENCTSDDSRPKNIKLKKSNAKKRNQI
jgi:hypothetical protein